MQIDNIKNTLILQTIKLLNSLLLHVLFLLIGLGLAQMVDILYKVTNNDFNQEKADKKSLIYNYLDLIGHSLVNTIVLFSINYILDNYLIGGKQMIYPLGWSIYNLQHEYGFEYDKEPEFVFKPALSFYFLFFQVNFGNRLRYCINRSYNPNTKVLLSNP